MLSAKVMEEKKYKKSFPKEFNINVVFLVLPRNG
jgi:hypothetical protein